MTGRVRAALLAMIAVAAILTGAGASLLRADEPKPDAKPADAAQPGTFKIEITGRVVEVQGAAGAANSAKTPFPSATPEAVVAVTKAIFPAVVRIDAKQEQYAEGKRRLVAGIGSGVIIDAQGRVLTNYHVAGRSAELYVTLFNKERIPAKLIGDDHWTDLAVLQMDMGVIRDRKIEFAFAEMGTSTGLVPGQDVMAIGTPFGLARTCTLGIVSNTDRTFYPERQRIDEYETGEFANWIQMDTPINPGNSGGPLVDMTGKLVGINTRGGGQNLNFAIPIDIAREVAASILATAKDGRKGFVPRSDLGLDLKPLQGFEAFYAIDINRGVLIDSVERNSPAARAGVAAQDILLELDGKPTNARFPEEIAPVRKRIADLAVGSKVTLTVKRGNDTVKLTATTEKLESSVGREQELKTWGLSVRDVTRAYANARLLDDDKGVVVTSLSPGYPAARAELESGDVVRGVNEKPVADLDEFVKIYEASVKAKEGTVLLDIRRRRTTQQVILKVTHEK